MFGGGVVLVQVLLIYNVCGVMLDECGYVVCFDVMSVGVDGCVLVIGKLVDLQVKVGDVWCVDVCG